MSPIVEFFRGDAKRRAERGEVGGITGRRDRDHAGPLLQPIRNNTELAARGRELAERFHEVAASDPANLTVPLEEQRRLRSLGYVQQGRAACAILRG